MELSERFIKKFEEEGFSHVYEWQDTPGTVYDEHAHTGKVALYVTDGSITFNIDGVKKELKTGDRIDVPIGAKHSAVVGSEGAIYIVGAEDENDA